MARLSKISGATCTVIPINILVIKEFTITITIIVLIRGGGIVKLDGYKGGSPRTLGSGIKLQPKARFA